jgi:dolichyl-phosphate beta-glucosyltransferase
MIEAPPAILVIPCFNEETRLPFDVLAKAARGPLALVMVDDGSTDGTLQELKKLSSLGLQVEVVALPRNLGKSHAVREGILRAREIHPTADWFGYWDADLSTPFDEVDAMLRYEAGMAGGYDAIWCSRVMRAGSEIQRTFHRHLFGRLFATAAGTLLGVRAYDTQCGAKLFRSEVVHEVFGEPFLSRWIFDVEIYLRLGHERILEYPMRTWRDVPGSKVKIVRESGRVLSDLLKLRRRYGSK